MNPMISALQGGWEERVALSLDQPEWLARQRAWGLALLLTGWLHLLAFAFCYYLTAFRDYHDAPGYLIAWVSEVVGMGLIFHLCVRRRRRGIPFGPPTWFVVRIWLAYFVLAFDLCSMNHLRGNRLFELFPAMASLASFGFLVMTLTINRWFFTAVLVMFGAGLLMAAYLIHAYLIFGLAWWLVLNGIGVTMLSGRLTGYGATVAGRNEAMGI